MERDEAVARGLEFVHAAARERFADKKRIRHIGQRFLQRGQFGFVAEHAVNFHDQAGAAGGELSTAVGLDDSLRILAHAIAVEIVEK